MTGRAAELAAYAGKADRTIKRITSEHYRPAVLRALGAGHPASGVVKPPAEVRDAIREDDITRVAASRRQVAVPRWHEIVQRAAGLLAAAVIRSGPSRYAGRRRRSRVPPPRPRT